MRVDGTAMSRRAAPPRLRDFAPVILVLLVGCSVAAGVYVALARQAKDSVARHVRVAAEERVELLRNSAERSLEVLHALSAFLEVSRPSRAQFQQFVHQSLIRLPEVQALEWIPRVPLAERPGFEEAARRDGLVGFRFAELGADGKLAPALERAEYFPVYYAEPSYPNRPALGLDLASDAARGAALSRAAATGSSVASAPVRLAQEQHSGQLGYLVFAPVREAHGHGSLRGFALAVFRVESLAAPAFASLPPGGFEVELVDATADERSLARFGGPVADARSDLRYRAGLELAGRRLAVTFTPSAAFAAAHRPAGLLGYPLCFVGLTLALAAHLVRNLFRAREVESKVAERTRDLRVEIVARQQVELMLRQAESKYRSIYENSVAGIFQVTPGGRYLSANPALARLYGYDSPAAFLQDAERLGERRYVRPRRRQRFLELLRREGSVTDFASELVRKDGRRIWVSETARVVQAGDGEPDYYEGSVRDISERVEAQRTLRRNKAWLEEQVRARTRELSHVNARLSAEVSIRREAQQQAARAHRAQSHFLASMSHEIRTPLNAIVGYAQLLHRDRADRSVHEATEVMLQSSHHLLALVDDVLDLSKIEAGHVALTPSDFDLECLVASLSFLFRNKCEQRGLSLGVEGLTGQACWVRGDEAKLRQVLINLLGNAVKFTERGQVTLGLVAEGMNTFGFEVVDTGPGIDAGDETHIFEAFSQGKNTRPGTGTGLGLAISRQLVELMGGTLSLQSQLGQGSRFRFSVQFESPVSVAPSQAHLSVPSARLAPGTVCRCLVVDDLDVNRKLLCQILDGLGCTSLGVASGEQALERAESFGPQLVFMDVLMPQMDGFQTTRALLDRLGGAPPRVVAFSASALANERRAYLNAGFDGFLPKPFRLQQVSECLSQLLGVSFVPDDEAPGQTAEAEAVPRDGLPPELLESLRNAARLYQATRLRSLLTELEGLGPAQARFARRLKGLADVYDMPAIARALEGEVVHG